MIVSFEGLDGSGKSKQLEMFQLLMGATAIPQFAALPRISPRMARAMMFTKVETLRLDLARLISPPDSLIRIEDARIFEKSLRTGHPYDIVVLDRSLDTTYSYSALFFKTATTEEAREYHAMISKWHTALEKPDITFYLQVSRETSIKRLKERAGNDGEFDGMAEDSWNLVASRYETLAHVINTNRIIVIDAERTINEVHADIVKAYILKVQELTK